MRLCIVTFHHVFINEKVHFSSVARLESLHRQVCGDATLPDELLYGRVGYIYALMFVNCYLGNNKINNDIILTVSK